MMALLQQSWNSAPESMQTSDNLSIFVYTYTLSFSCSVVSDSLQSHRLQHARLPCPSLSPRSCSNSCALNWWCYPTISSSVIPFSSCLQSFPASGSFPTSWLFASAGQSIGASASASILPVNIQGRFPLGLTGWISLQSKGLSRVFSSTTVQKLQFFFDQLSLWSNSHIHTWPLEKPKHIQVGVFKYKSIVIFWMKKKESRKILQSSPLPLLCTPSHQ